jgi:three-Cys-motif partner protein
MPPKSIIWDLDPHTAAKHQILQKYLGAWFPILASAHGRVVFIDGFCGPGRYSGGETGSPIIAIVEALRHGAKLNNCELVFIFMDKHKDRVAHLRSEVAKIPVSKNFHIDIRLGEFEEEFRRMLNSLDASQYQLAPTFAFVDPFGFSGLPYELVERLLRKPRTEVLINLMIDPINRFIAHPDDPIRAHIESTLGLKNVEKLIEGATDRLTAIRLLYQQQLSRAAKYVRYFEMRNSHDRTLYYLFFATNHPLGLEKMKDAFWRVDPTSGSRFSDATNPNQLVLFSEDAEAFMPALGAEIASAFAGQTVSVRDVLDYVNVQTAFLEKHGKAALKLLEVENKVSFSPTKQDGKPRRKNSCPPEAVVSFPSANP